MVLSLRGFSALVHLKSSSYSRVNLALFSIILSVSTREYRAYGAKVVLSLRGFSALVQLKTTPYSRVKLAYVSIFLSLFTRKYGVNGA